MSSVYTLAEIDEEIAQTKAAIKVVRNGGKSYNLNDGMGSQSVTRSTLKELRADLEDLKAEREDIIGLGAGIAMGGGRNGN